MLKIKLKECSPIRGKKNVLTLPHISRADNSLFSLPVVIVDSYIVPSSLCGLQNHLHTPLYRWGEGRRTSTLY